MGRLILSESLSNASGEEVVKAAFGSNYLPTFDHADDLVTTGWVIPTGMAVGEYTAAVTLSLHNGAQATAEYSFNVE